MSAPAPRPAGRPRRIPRDVTGRLPGKLRGDARGVAAVEFAMILPVLVTMYFGVTELVRALDTNRKISQYARTIADLSGRATNAAPTSDDMATILGAAGAIMRPYPTDDLKIVVNAMGVENISGTLYGGVCSSYAQNATARARLTINGTSGLPTTPATFLYDGARYVLAEVSLSYTPVIGSNLYKMIFGSKGLVFSRQISWAERLDKGEVVMPGGTACPVY